MRAQSLCVLFAIVGKAHAAIETLTCDIYAVQAFQGEPTFTVRYAKATGVMSTCPVGVTDGCPEVTLDPATAECETVVKGLEILETTTCSCHEEAACFPGNSTVELADGSFVSMDNLQVGDSVRVADGFADVFMFTHVEKSTRLEFVEINTESGRTLSISSGHLLHVGDAKDLKAAGTVEEGHTITLADGTTDKVVGITKAVKAGIYAPQTTTGEIVVDGVLASCFTDYSSPALQRAMLAPIRLMYEVNGAYWLGANADAGIPEFLRETALAFKNKFL